MFPFRGKSRAHRRWMLRANPMLRLRWEKACANGAWLKKQMDTAQPGDRIQMRAGEYVSHRQKVNKP